MTKVRGASLVELCLSLVLASVLAAGVRINLGGLVEAHRARQAEQLLAQATFALLGYAQSHGHLPCPADAGLPEHAPGAGQARAHRDGECIGGYGGELPWATLGLAERDPWGERLTYRVIREFANAIDECSGRIDAKRSICVTETTVSPWPAHDNALEVRRRLRSGALRAATEPIAVGLAAVVVSHGANRSSGRDAGSHFTANTISADERMNGSPTSVSFIQRPEKARVVGCDDAHARAEACAFDDRLAWIGRSEVVRRLVQAGRAL